MNRSATGRRGRTWLRVLTLLLALWVPAAHAGAQAAPALTAGAAEHDVLDTALRPPAAAVHRADAPKRPTPLPGSAPTRPAAPPCPAAPRAPHAPFLLRTVVLRC